MKRIGIIFVFLLAGVWLRAATNELQFISVLSAPVASFGTVETKSCAVVTPASGEEAVTTSHGEQVMGMVGVVNLGYGFKNAPYGGTIKLKSSAPMHVKIMEMGGAAYDKDDHTTLAPTILKIEGPWYVNSLLMGGSSTYEKGELTVATDLKIKDLIIENQMDGDTTTTLQSTDLTLQGTYYVQNLDVKKLKIGNNFETTNESSGTATWGTADNRLPFSNKETMEEIQKLEGSGLTWEQIRTNQSYLTLRI